MKIAIDGPAASGKSSIASHLSKELNIWYLNTGRMYRALCAFLLENNLINFETMHVDLKNITMEIDQSNDVFINEINMNYSFTLDDPSFLKALAKMAANKHVRHFLNQIQKEIIENSDSIILDGRDIGTIIMPEANYKFYINATLEERTRRRIKDFKSKGITKSFEKTYENLKKRDEKDLNRKYGPLKKADDAISIDTDEKSLEEVVSIILKIIKN